MLEKSFILFLFLLNLSMIQGDLTNLNDILTTARANSSKNYTIGALSKANSDVIKRYLFANIDIKIFEDKAHLLEAIDNETVIAGVTTGQTAEDLEPRYHVFSSLIISPQAMLVAPDYNNVSAPYGLKSQPSNDLYDALNAAIVDVQREDLDESLLTKNNRTDLVRVYTCQQESPLPVINRDETTGYLRDIIIEKKTLLIGGIGPSDWGVHDGNYKVDNPTGFYPQLLDAIVDKLGKLKGPDGIIYSEKIKFNRTYFANVTGLFQALLNGDIHATDVYLLINAPYTGTNEVCSDGSSCRARESCVQGVCTHPPRPRSLHFRSTCTTASRDTKFITKKNGRIFKTNTEETVIKRTPKTRWIAFLLLITALFGAIFLTLVILIRRKKYYRLERTAQGGFGKFARLQEESEPRLEGFDAFDDHIVQAPTDNHNSTN